MKVPTIFDTILNPKANKNRQTPSDSDLTAEAVLMLLAGMDTTANALVVGTWGVLQDSKIYQKLVQELDAVLGQIDTEVTTEMIERLPYLVKFLAILYSNYLFLTCFRGL